MVTKSNIEKLIVVRPGVAVPTAGDRLYADATGVFNLGVGGIGAYVDEPGSGNPTALDPSAYAGEPFRFIQVRDTSNDSAVLPDRILEQSQHIHNRCSMPIEIAGVARAGASPSSWLVGQPTGTVGEIGVSSSNQYVLRAAAHGYRTDMKHSVYNTPVVQGRFTSPDWASTSYSTKAVRQDYTVKALVRDFNRQSANGFNRHAVAIAIDTTGTTTTGPTIASVISGGSGATITIGYERGCQAVNLLVTENMLQAFTDLESKLTTATASGGFGLGAGDAKIALYAMPEFDCASAIEVAGDGSATADMIFVVALDDEKAHYDELKQTKKRINVSLDQGDVFGTATRTKVSSPQEAKGSARDLRIMYENTEHYRSYTSSKRWGANHVAYPDEIIDTETYDIYTITHCHNRVATSGMPSQSQLLTMLALVNFENTDSAYYDSGNPNPQKTYIESIINAVADYNGLPDINL